MTNPFKRQRGMVGNTYSQMQPMMGQIGPFPFQPQPHLHPFNAQTPMERPVSAPTNGGIVNNNNGAGTFNTIKGHQYNNDNSVTSNEVFEGDKFDGPIYGGNVGGRHNNNTINDPGTNKGPSLPWSGGTTGIQGTTDWERYGRNAAEIRKVEREIDNLMDQLGYDENLQLEERLRGLDWLKERLKERLPGTLTRGRLY